MPRPPYADGRRRQVLVNYRSLQAPTSVVMVRPHRFGVNPETGADNAFQAQVAEHEESLAASALAEFDAAVATLTAAGVKVHVFEDFGEFDTPDSVFPNNWFSTHQGGRVAIYPMFAVNRRRERRADVIELLKAQYRVQEVIDYSGLEYDNLFLEGTGAMVFDHAERVAYVAASHRADPVILERFCTAFGYEPMVFPTADASGRPIYHTNVLMSIATDYALICTDAIADARRGVYAWIDSWYNARRRHSKISYLSPLQYEHHLAQQADQPALQAA